MSVWADGEWHQYDPRWTREYCDYVDRLRTEGLRYHPVGFCRKCLTVHLDPHLNPCATYSDRRNPLHKPDWGTP
jgi:hypothetical protein